MRLIARDHHVIQFSTRGYHMSLGGTTVATWVVEARPLHQVRVPAWVNLGNYPLDPNTRSQLAIPEKLNQKPTCNHRNLQTREGTGRDKLGVTECSKQLLVSQRCPP